jgi:hypothetical protein
VRGNEYAWPLSAVEEVVTAARACGLANLGGQAQFRIPEGTCELYWLAADSSARLPGEPWDRYVNRSADEVLARFRDVRQRTDFIQEGLVFEVLRGLHERGADLNHSLCFVLYFDGSAAIQKGREA